MFRGWLRHTWDCTSTIWQAIAETNRDSKQRPQPYTVFDVHPIRGPEGDKGQVSESDAQQEGRFWADIGWATRFSGDAQSNLVHSIMERHRGR